MDLSQVLSTVTNTDIVVLAGDMNAKVGRLSQSERYLGGHFGVDSCRTDNGERFLQLCTDHRLFIASTNFQHKRSHRVTWRPLNCHQDWSQLDHIAISYRWRMFITDCRSHWNTYVNSDHALVCATLNLTMPRATTKKSPSVPSHVLQLDNSKQHLFRNALSNRLTTVQVTTNVDEHWNCIKSAMMDAFDEVCPPSNIT